MWSLRPILVILHVRTPLALLTPTYVLKHKIPIRIPQARGRHCRHGRSVRACHQTQYAAHTSPQAFIACVVPLHTATRGTSISPPSRCHSVSLIERKLLVPSQMELAASQRWWQYKGKGMEVAYVSGFGLRIYSLRSRDNRDERRHGGAQSDL